MIKFDLEKALAGDKIVTRDGREVKQLIKFNGIHTGNECIYAAVDGRVLEFQESGKYDKHSRCDDNEDLFMAPKQLSGFVNYYLGDYQPTYHDTKIQANTINNWPTNHRIALIDLSQFPEGHGL